MTMAMQLYDLPQDPFYPQETLSGPGFLDSEACLCALRETPDADSRDALWHCIGDQSEGVYASREGKWFATRNGGTDADGPIYDASNPPDTSRGLAWSASEGRLVPEDEVELSVWNDACTGRNRSSFTTSYYRATAQLEADQDPIDAAPCWRRGSVPLEIQTVEDWQEMGCMAGFLCANNTVNSLPQYCPPYTFCQSARLAGMVCMREGRNIPMGPFEPVVCQAGYYCPPESHGSETLRCPAGSYCQPGATSPTPCGLASICPEGAVREYVLMPLIILAVLDVLLVVGFFVLSLRRRLRMSSQGHLSSLPKPGRMRAQITGYKEIQDDHEDQEGLAMNSSYVPSSDYAGFEAALAMETLRAAEDEVTTKEDDLPPQLRPFVESMRRATDATSFGLSFGYTNLRFQPKNVAKPILQNVTGRIERGSLAAVMGGSGAGKSTFVNVLMGKTSHTGGTVTVNNEVVKIKRYKKLIGYVPQDDIVLPELTVFENILHSARVRLPRTWSAADVRTHVDSVIECLELSHVRDSLVGSVAKPVLSGGQRKRVSIGMELAAAPMAIFLDEPTSGLDATAASSIMRTLKALARLGISVIVIIHQPRAEIFDMLDNLILLGNGQTIYEGRQAGCRGYFEGLGFLFPEHSNHGDVLTDIITGNGRPYKRAGDISKEALISNWAATRRETDDGEDEAHDEGLYVRLSSLVATSRPVAVKNRGARRVYQLWLSLQRSALQQYRSIGSFAAEMALSALAGFLLGLAQHSKEGVLFTGIYNEPYQILSVATDFRSAPEMALLVAIAIGLVSGAPGVKVFSEEMLLHRRESEAGHSRIAYFVAKVLSVVPRMALACLHFTTPLLLLSTPIVRWEIALLANLLYFYCIYGLANVVSMIVRREDAPLFATMLSLIVGILSGSAPPLAQVRDWHMEWLWRASPGTWLAEVYFGQLVNPFTYLYNTELAAEATGFHLTWIWRNMGTLLGIGTIYRIIAFAMMVSLPRLRK
ncbi:hypothetical protein S40293_03813 [Stachybotrys chartarum IBT 40293]|nr:hypothetical protein S40293_03813 [Stachybotrys chartarum IBT 40293]KFA81642.1 hypothetical protein S40288_09173 [Stachybotrys chartarum IBT 40288]